MHIIVTLSWFHRKVGPMVFYYYPEGELKEDQKIRIADQIDQAFEEGFFSHSFDNLISMNYYFEIFSKWARGQKEMLMLSTVFDESVSSDREHMVLAKCIDFAKRLKEDQEMFKAFYSDEDPQYAEESKNIKKYNETIREWVKELYWTTIEETREKTEEEKLADLMNEKTTYDLVRFLSHGPVSKEDLKFWFNIKYPNVDIEKDLKKLEAERIVFINDIGVENYVLLVKKISVTRIPPEYLISFFEEKPELEELTEKFYEKVREYFNSYEATAEDSLVLFSLVANPKIYNVLSQLRTGPIAKNKITSIVSKDQLEEIIKILNKLRIYDIIDEYQEGGEPIVVLKTDIRFTTGFPEYLKALIPKETKEQIAKSYQPKRPEEVHIKNIALEDAEPKEVKDDIFEVKDDDLLNKSEDNNDIFEDLKSLSDSFKDLYVNQEDEDKEENLKKSSKPKTKSNK